MANKGDLVEFKPGLFSIDIPNNFGIFVKSYKKKNSKERHIELLTIKGKQSTKQTNVMKKKLGERLQLINNILPSGKELALKLDEMIKRVNERESKVTKIEKEVGELSERALWSKLVNTKLYDSSKAYSVEELAFVWYGVQISELSRNRIKKVKSSLDSCKVYGQGYFDFESGNNWKPITVEIQKEVGREVSILGAIRNKMFHLIEVPVEESEDPEETEIIRAPMDWENISLTKDDNKVFDKLKKLMAFFVEEDVWPEIGIGNTHIFALDGFSLRNFVSSLAEDWVNEGRTSYSDAFVKLLIRVGFWNDSEALLIISKRVVKLAPHFDWITDERIEEIASKFKEPKDTPSSFDNRTNLQQLESYTIDPPTAKDFDDAISLEFDPKKKEYTLWVHIADVAHYVEKDSSLDIHARGRATSVYLPTKTIPMLPTHLSDNLCSLNEQLPRLSMSVEIHYDSQGNKKLDKCKIHNSVIFVTKNLSYNDVNESIKSNIEPFVSLNNFAKILQNGRKGLKLETDEVRLELEGKMAITTKKSSASTKMIEAFMVAANETVAELLQRDRIPVTYRGHPLPDQVNIEKFNAHSKVMELGLNLEIKMPEKEESETEEESSGSSLLDILSQGGSGGNISFSLGGTDDYAAKLKEQLEEKKEETSDENVSTIKGLAQLNEEEREAWLLPYREVIKQIEKIENSDRKKMAYLTVLRSLSKALYSESNFGHFGLGSIAYIHFTSPIRRYPDVIAHRVCKAMIAGEDFTYDLEELENLSLHCNEQADISEKLERTISGAGFSFLTRNPKYTENKQGIISSITGGAIYVMLPNGIEVKVRMSKFSSRPTFIDEHSSMCFVGFASTDQIAEEVTVDTWRDLLSDADSDEPIEILAKLGDKIAVEFSSWNHIEGKVEAIPISSATDGDE